MNRKAMLLPVITILLMAVILFGVSSGLSQLRADNIQKEHIYMMQTLLPGSVDFVREPYTGEDANIRSVHKAENGFVIETVTRGYVDDISMMIGVSNEGTVTGLVIRDMNETFGLGAKALNDANFLAQFLNTSGDAEVGTNVDAVTGATVTSKAITRSINSAVAVVTGADAASAATSWGG